MSIKDVEVAIRHGRQVMDDYWDLVAHREIYTRYTIIDPIIRALGWETHDPDQCEVEYQRGQQGYVDYALFNRDGKPVILIEAKRIDQYSIDFESQLARYSRGIQNGVSVLTDGQLWNLYNLCERGSFSSKFIDTIDIYEDNLRQSAQFLNRILSRRAWW